MNLEDERAYAEALLMCLREQVPRWRLLHDVAFDVDWETGEPMLVARYLSATGDRVGESRIPIFNEMNLHRDPLPPHEMAGEYLVLIAEDEHRYAR